MDGGNMVHETRRMVTLTPELASQWWDRRNKRNRSLTQAHYEMLTRAMVAGQWRYTGDPIRFDTRGTMIDGHHRVMAVMRSGVSIVVDVIENLPDGIVDLIDTNVLVRTKAQSLAMDGVKNAHAVTSWCRVINQITTRRMGAMEGYEVRAIMQRNSAGIQWASDHMVCGDTWCRSPFVGAMVWAYPTDPDAVRAFGAQVRHGENIDKTMPSFSMRTYAMGSLSRTEAPRTRAIKTLVALESHIKGRQCQKIYVERADAVLEFFNRAAADKVVGIEAGL